MQSVEAEGDNIDAAIGAALKMLGVPRERVEIEILANAARGLFGIGGRKARVRATLRSPVGTELAEDLGGEAHALPRMAERPAASVAVDSQTQERARQVLQEIIGMMQMSAGVDVRTEGDHIVLDLTGDSSGMLIGRRGQMLDALEYVINRIVARDEASPTRIVLDSANYRARRREALEVLARRMGEQAKRKRRPVTLNPMSPRDRRIVHLVLQEDPSLTTKSSGRGHFRRLVIIPEGAAKVARGGG
jgi:spoIIIJ-associated protein